MDETFLLSCFGNARQIPEPANRQASTKLLCLGDDIEWDAKFVILSKDKGFDSLLRHIASAGCSCRRVETLTKSGVTKAMDADANLTRVLTLLRNVEKKSRPRRCKTLLQYIGSVFQKKLPEAEVQKIASSLFSQKLVSETNNALTYHF